MLSSSFCSILESAFLSLDRFAIKKIERSNRFYSRLVLYFLGHLNKLITTILIFTLLSNIIATLSANTIFIYLLSELFGIVLVENSLTSFLSQVVFVVSFTLVFLLFCEFGPKRISILNPKLFTQMGGVLILPVYVVLYPVVYLLFSFSEMFKWFNRFFTDKENNGNANNGEKVSTGEEFVQSKFLKSKSSKLDKRTLVEIDGPADQKDQKRNASKDVPIYRYELLGFIEKVFQKGGLQQIETNWLMHLFFYMNTSISSIMVNRDQLVGIDYNSLNGNNVFPMLKKFPYRNIPIYREDMDRIEGIVSKKEVILRHKSAHLSKEELLKYSHKALLLPKTKNILEVLRDIYHHPVEVAIVTDEHGGIAGIVSSNHIVNKIFERVSNDEGDSLNISKLDETTFVVKAEIDLEDFNHFFGVELTSEDYKSLGGYLLERFKYIPKKGESVEDMGFRYTIRNRTPKRILSVEVIRK